MLYRHIFSLLSLLALAAFATSAVAEDHPAESKPGTKPAASTHPHPKPAHQGQPQVESRGFGAWALRCAKETGKPEKDKGKEQEATKPVRYCEISEIIEAPNHGGTLAKITVGRPGGGKGPLSALVLVPNNVSFPSAVHIRSDEKDIWGVELDWVRCIPGGCFAQTTLADATIERWRSLKSTGSIVFRDASGQEVTLGMTFDGFGDALDAYTKAQ